MSRLPLAHAARQLSGHALLPGRAATDTRRNATSGTLALAVVQKRSVLAQSAHGARAVDHQVGRGCFE
jgi:hypothetical protein